MGDAEWDRIIKFCERLNEQVKQRRSQQVEDTDKGEVEHIAGLVREYMARIRPQLGEAIMGAKMADQPGIMRQIILFDDPVGITVRMHLFSDVNETYIHTHKCSFWSIWLCGGMYMHKVWMAADDDGRHWKHVRNPDGSAGQKVELKGSLTGAMQHTHRSGAMYFIKCDTPHTVIGQKGEKVVTLCVRGSASDRPAFIYSESEDVQMGNEEERRSTTDMQEKARVVEKLRQLFVAGHENPRALLDQALQRWLALNNEDEMIAEWPNLIGWFLVSAINTWRHPKIKHKPAVVHMLADPRDGPPLVSVLEKVLQGGGDGLSLDAQRADGCTCLHLAYFTENRDLVDLLIGLGANKEITNTRGETPPMAEAAKKSPRARFKWRRSVDDLLHIAVRYLADFDATDFATAFSRLAKLRDSSPEKLVRDHRFKVLVNAALQRIEYFHTDAVCITAWSFAKLNYTELEQDFIDKLSVMAVQCDYSSHLAAQHLSNLAWAYATLEFADEKVFKKVAAESILKINEFDPQGLANIAWAFAKLKLPHRVPLKELFGKIAGEAVLKVKLFKPLELSMLTWAFAKLGIPYTWHKELFDKIAAESILKINWFDPQGLIMMAWAFKTLEIPHPALLDAIAERMGSR